MFKTIGQRKHLVRESIQSEALLGVCFWFALCIMSPALLEESDRRKKMRNS